MLCRKVTVTADPFMHSGMVLLSKYWILALSFLLFCFFSFAGATDLTAQTEGVEKIFIQRGFEQIAVIRVATVSDRKAMEKGLSGKPPIPDDFGMLFIIDSSREHFFWMKNMEFPIDILFFDKDRKLTEILTGLTPCEECTKYKAPEDTAYALEINAGMAEGFGIKAGDSIVFDEK